MNTMAHIFPQLSTGQCDELYQFFLGRFARPHELEWLKKNANDPWFTNGAMAFRMPWEPHKKTLLLYGCCHVGQLVKFWTRYSTSRTIDMRYNLAIAQNYRMQGDAHYQPGQSRMLALLPNGYRELFLALFRKADAIVTHPAYGGSEFDPNHLISMLASEKVQHIIKFHSPSFAALWPVCYFGDSWLKALLREGHSPEKLIAQLDQGTLDCQLKPRCKAAFSRLVTKDKLVDIDIAPFFNRFWRTNRMFTAFNHPSFNLMAYQALRIERRVEKNETRLGILDYAMLMSLPWDCCQMRPLWPDHPIVAKELRVNYPHGQRIEDTVGFYKSEILRCAQEVNNEK